jgi:hypothetical protein
MGNMTPHLVKALRGKPSDRRQFVLPHELEPQWKSEDQKDAKKDNDYASRRHTQTEEIGLPQHPLKGRGSDTPLDL